MGTLCQGLGFTAGSTAPMLLLGGQSTALPESAPESTAMVSEQEAEAFSAAAAAAASREIVTLSGSGRYPHTETPDEFLEAVVGFFGRPPVAGMYLWCCRVKRQAR